MRKRTVAAYRGTVHASESLCVQPRQIRADAEARVETGLRNEDEMERGGEDCGLTRDNKEDPPDDTPRPTLQKQQAVDNVKAQLHLHGHQALLQNKLATYQMSSPTLSV